MTILKHIRATSLIIVVAAAANLLISCGLAQGTDPAIGTAEDRKALFEYLIQKTLEREAFSPAKNRHLNLDVEKSMREQESSIVNASTQEELFYALARLSKARKDRHLSIQAIEGGLQAPAYYPGTDAVTPIAAIRVEVDYSVPDDVVLFVSDVATDNSVTQGIQAGDRILTVNGVSPAQRFEQGRPYTRYSTEHGFRKAFSKIVTTRTGLLPAALYRDTFDLKFQNKDGEAKEVNLAYVDPMSLEWVSDSRDNYRGFERVAEHGTYDLYVSTGDTKVIVLDWHRFNSTIIEDMDWLMKYAEANDLLDHDIYFDATRGGGGSLGVYAIQRLSPKPFKTTFGNLRISDVIPQFIADHVADFEMKLDPTDSGGKETIDDGTWLNEWLTDDLQKAYDSGQEYSNNVPFKLAHAPKHSDGIIQPADVHFNGSMVCAMGPNGGSHLDQFYAIVTDNGLCDTIGMKTGGYSNTWEWEEDVVFPTTGKPVVRFMWNIGHTISPNGKIVEGDPAEIGEFIPLTRENFAEYDQILLDRALEILASE